MPPSGGAFGFSLFIAEGYLFCCLGNRVVNTQPNGNEQRWFYVRQFGGFFAAL